jgi:DNA-binding YbaB/EbfC family protein
MFGSDMIAKLTQMKHIAEESKMRLESQIVEGESGSGLVMVSMNGNREIISVKINTDIKLMEKEDLEDLLCVALKRAMDQANKLNEEEVANSTKGLFPGF